MARLLGVKQLLLDEAKANLGKARGVLAGEIKKLDQLEAELHNAINTSMDHVAPSAFMQRQRYLDNQDKRIKEQTAEIQKAENVVEQCRQKLQETHVDLKKLEKHKEKLQKVWQKKKDQDLAKANDEIGTTLDFFKKNIDDSGAEPS